MEAKKVQIFLKGESLTLSKELSSVILPHDYFVTHLNNKSNTADEQLEL